MPAHALFFNRFFDLLTSAIQAFGIPALDQIPNWVAQFFRIAAYIVVGGIIIALLRARQGDDEEVSRGVSKIIRILLTLGLGDLLLSIIGV
jgi:hypothetical protein